MRWSETCLLFYCCCSGHFKIPAGGGGSKDWHQVSSLIVSLRQSLTEPEFANSANRAGQQAPEILLFQPPQVYTMQVCSISTVMYYTGVYYTQLVYMGSGESNSGLHTCTANSLLTDLPPQPPRCSFIPRLFFSPVLDNLLLSHLATNLTFLLLRNLWALLLGMCVSPWLVLYRRHFLGLVG